MNRFWSPIHLSGTVGPLTNIGDDLSVNTRLLLNPNRGPMLIDQFRFSVPDALGAAAMAAIACEIRLGSIPLTAKAVTLGAFAPRYTGFYGGLDSNAVGNSVGSDTLLVWHLAKPLFVPQDVSVSMRFVRQRLFANGTLTEPTVNFSTVRGSIVGRSLPEDEPTPERIWVPWVCETKAQVAASEFVSGDSDLINSHSEPLHVKSFCAVNYIAGSSSPVFLVSPADLRVQMTASNGTAIIRDPTPFGLVFPFDRGVLDVDALLQPGEFVRCAVEIPSTPAGASATDAQVQFTAIGMTGYRFMPSPKSNR